MLGLVYRESVVGTVITNGQLSPNLDLGIKASAQIGTFFGQLIFGWLADVLGRKRMCKHASVCLYAKDPNFNVFFFLFLSVDGIELTIMTIATFGQAVAGSARAVNIFAVIMAWRFFVSNFRIPPSINACS